MIASPSHRMALWHETMWLVKQLAVLALGLLGMWIVAEGVLVVIHKTAVWISGEVDPELAGKPGPEPRYPYEEGWRFDESVFRPLEIHGVRGPSSAQHPAHRACPSIWRSAATIARTPSRSARRASRIMGRVISTLGSSLEST